MLSTYSSAGDSVNIKITQTSILEKHLKNVQVSRDGSIGIGKTFTNKSGRDIKYKIDKIHPYTLFHRNLVT